MIAGTRVNPASDLRIAAGGRFGFGGAGSEQQELTHKNTLGEWGPRARLTRGSPPGALKLEAPSRGRGEERDS